jgi:hypothetical protein
LGEFERVAVRQNPNKMQRVRAQMAQPVDRKIMKPLFVATEPFGPRAGDNWTGFVQWSGLTQLTELVSLDSMMCPSVLQETKQEYWPHIVNESFMLNFFTDLPFLLNEVSSIEEKNLLCVFRNPPQEPKAPAEIVAFEFLGYDLLDTEACASALSNCGGFPDVFQNDELSQHGLIRSFGRALEIQTNLRKNHPEEHHADCDVWAIFRLPSKR